jgi:uncharacterized protein YcgI (DUF1989 family)
MVLGPMDKKEIRNRLKECFKRCASGRTQLRNCVIDIMDAGLTKQDVLDHFRYFYDTGEYIECNPSDSSSCLVHGGKQS